MTLLFCVSNSIAIFAQHMTQGFFESAKAWEREGIRKAAVLKRNRKMREDTRDDNMNGTRSEVLGIIGVTGSLP